MNKYLSKGEMPKGEHDGESMFNFFLLSDKYLLYLCVKLLSHQSALLKQLFDVTFAVSNIYFVSAS